MFLLDRHQRNEPNKRSTRENHGVFNSQVREHLHFIRIRGLEDRRFHDVCFRQAVHLLLRSGMPPFKQSLIHRGLQC